MANNQHRTKQAVKNASFSMGAQVLQQLLRVLVRIVFIQKIGQEYLGLNSVFTEILTALQLVELGVGPAMAYSLYKPLSENNTEKVKSLMNLFKKAYITIGVIILVAGIAFTPFYGFFINEIPDLPNMNLIYIIFVIDTAISYFYSYYRTLLVSDQKKYLDISIQTAVITGISVFQMIIMTVTHNYILYLVGQVTGTVLTNVIASKVALKNYPYLKDKNIQKLGKEDKHEIKKNIFAMVFHKVGSIVRDATDNLFISKYIGLAVSGIYSNYSMITKALTTLISQVFTAVLSSVGNLHATADDKAQKEVFYNINFINFWIASFFACCFGVLADSFILAIADESYLLDFLVVILVSIRFYLDIMRKTPWMFCEAAGVYWKGKTKSLWEAAINLVVSLVLVKTIGMPGIFIGTIITILVVDLPLEPYLVFKYVLKGGLAKYYLRYILYFVITSAMFVATYFVCNIIPGVGVIVFIIKGIIAVIVTNLVFIACTFRMKEFKYASGLVKKYISKAYDKLAKKV